MKTALKLRLRVTSAMANNFVRIRIPFPLFQSMICGPMCGCDKSFLSNLGDPLAKQ